MASGEDPSKQDDKLQEEVSATVERLKYDRSAIEA